MINDDDAGNRSGYADRVIERTKTFSNDFCGLDVRPWSEFPNPTFIRVPILTATQSYGSSVIVNAAHWYTR